MRSLGIALLTLALASSALAVENPPRPAVLVIQPQDTQRFDIEVGAAVFNTHAAQVRVAWLPRLAPLPGTLPRSEAEIPNAFQLLGTTIPQRPSEQNPRTSVIIRP